MAVIEHEVHDVTKRGADSRWGCWNRKEFSEGYLAPNGYAEMMDDRRGHFDARVKLLYVPHRMSRECRNDISLSDPKCAGCKHVGSGEEYSLNVRTNGK